MHVPVTDKLSMNNQTPTGEQNKQFHSFLFRRPYLIEVDDPDNMMEVLSRLGRSLIRVGEFDQ